MKRNINAIFRSTFVFCLTFVVLEMIAFAEEPLLRDDFESIESGISIATTESWNAFEGFRGDNKPNAKVGNSVGTDQSKALMISHVEPFRADNWGVRRQLAEPISDGVAWLQCRIKLPKTWQGGLFFDARGAKSNQVIARIAAAPYKRKVSDAKLIRWHGCFNRAFWRLYSTSAMDQDWHTLTLRIDYSNAQYAAWADDLVLGEELPLPSRAAISQIHIGIAGTPEDPAVMDDLIISRVAPDGFSDPQLHLEPEDDLQFRFAVAGDPQLGFTSIETDKVRFAHATNQINRSGADLTLILGDMVHFNRDRKAYEQMQELAKGFKNPFHYVRGNHEPIDLYKEFFHDELDYSVVHKSLRFVIIDAVGNHAGLSDEQLKWIESEFVAAEKAGEEIVTALHVSPWQNNERGKGKYNQIGEGRDRLRELMKKHKVLISLSGHYHRPLWHAHEDQTHYFVLGGTALVSGGPTAWCSFDVYPDRIVMHQKPVFFAFEVEGVEKAHTGNDWIGYERMKKKHSYAQQGPLTIKRHRPVE